MKACSGTLRHIGSQLFILFSHHKFFLYSSKFSFSIPLEAPTSQAPQPTVQEIQILHNLRTMTIRISLDLTAIKEKSKRRDHNYCVEYKKGRGDCCREY